jgi:hypothetical protein
MNQGGGKAIPSFNRFMTLAPPSPKKRLLKIQKTTRSGGRVTRLGAFSPIGLFITLEIFLKIKEIVRIFGILLSRKKLCIDFDKNRLGCI